MGEEKKYSFLEAKQKIEKWCAYQERSHYDVRKKLFEYGMDSEDTDRLIAHLITYNFLNEQRFADSFTSGKHRINKWGKNKISAYLKQKQVPEKCIKDALKTLDEEEYLETLKGLATKKIQEKKGTLFERKVKTQNFLLSKGYEMSLIYDVLENLE